MTWVDWVVILLILIGVFEGLIRGFVAQVVRIVALILGTVVGFMVSSVVASWMGRELQLASSFIHPLALILSLTVVTAIFQLIGSIILRVVNPLFQANPLNRIGGAVVGLVRQMVIISVVLAVVLALPLSSQVKQLLERSRVVRPLLTLASAMEKRFGSVLGSSSLQGFDYQLVGVDDTASTALNYTVTDPKVDLEAEGKLFLLTNTIRQQYKKSALQPNEKLREIAEAHARDMLAKGYFSHLSPPDNQDVSARLKEAGVTATAVGENLATAMTLESAQAGLLTSSGHRNILLSDQYNQVGIGVLDAGEHGKMIVEVFAQIP